MASRDYTGRWRVQKEKAFDVLSVFFFFWHAGFCDHIQSSVDICLSISPLACETLNNVDAERNVVVTSDVGGTRYAPRDVRVTDTMAPHQIPWSIGVGG